MLTTTRARPVRDDCRHSAHVCDWVTVGEFAKALQLSQQLQYDFLLNVVSLRTLRFAVRVETKFKANDAFDDRLGVNCDQLRKERVNLFVAGLSQQRLEQDIDLDRRLFHRRKILSLNHLRDSKTLEIPAITVL